jgi:hypothetical protein
MTSPAIQTQKDAQFSRGLYTSSFDPLRNIRFLQDNWDENGAPKPSNAAIANAEVILAWSKKCGLFIDDIDGDVDGGVFIAIANEHNRSIHFYCGNEGRTCQILKINGKQIAYSQWDPNAAIQFLSQNA